MIILYYVKKLNKQKWELNFLEFSFLSFGIGLSIYICLGLILDIFHFFNFFSAYLSIIIVDIIFIIKLIHSKELNKDNLSNYFNNIKKVFNENRANYIILFAILALILTLQFILLWNILAQSYSLISKDPYFWVGDAWYLLDNGYLNREGLRIHYPRVFSFFTAGSLLITNDPYIYFAFFKFGAIPYFSFFLLIMATILKRIFKKNYLVFFGLLMVLISNFLISRVILFISSSICVLLLLIYLIVITSKCPFYLTGFFIPPMYLFNPLYGFFFYIVLGLYLILKFFFLDKKFKAFIVNDIFKTLIVTIILFIPYVLFLFFVQNLSIFDVLSYFLNVFGLTDLAVLPHTSLNYNYKMLDLLNFSEIAEILFPDNPIMESIFELESFSFSYFIIFAFIGLFLKTISNEEKNHKNVLIFGKICILIIIFFYAIDILFPEGLSILSESSSWFKNRALEFFTAPFIIIACFTIEIIIEKSKKVTNFLSIHFEKYNNLIHNKRFFSNFIRIESILIIILLISSSFIYFSHQSIYHKLNVKESQMKSIFYIKENIPENSKILVPYLGEGNNYLYNLLFDYRCTIWDYEENNITTTKSYIFEHDIKYILLDTRFVNSTELNEYEAEPAFKELFNENINIIFEYNE